jgi:hypothetical protein
LLTPEIGHLWLCFRTFRFCLRWSTLPELCARACAAMRRAALAIRSASDSGGIAPPLLLLPPLPFQTQCQLQPLPPPAHVQQMGNLLELTLILSLMKTLGPGNQCGPNPGSAQQQPPWCQAPERFQVPSMTATLVFLPRPFTNSGCTTVLSPGIVFVPSLA